ncbi:hypothetical protein [Caballeronia zhejiangensis]|uniref:hypothetical protein n=1 Tax=Caballeronia zhejiangensis TaxID=871203 RepID=UPI001F52044D|nr:hypothetical protein [Caballeronia zhejiangensis]MCI1046915.1 hypothetical protein [Caballeronia zhejiangensis]
MLLPSLHSVRLLLKLVQPLLVLMAQLQVQVLLMQVQRQVLVQQPQQGRAPPILEVQPHLVAQQAVACSQQVAALHWRATRH